ncbi:MAG: hypothetical protein WC822_03090 [Candidatus Paceibacterota bacterium]|jgi:hypothetical protein
MNTTVDLLQIKIDNAKAELSEESRNAIDAIDWKNVIIGMREERGYSFTQLETLEMETELLLCGLIEPENYPKELETRMGLPRAQVDELVNEMNDKVFKKIREELVKNIERKKIEDTSPDKERKEGLNLESREEMLEKIQNVDLSAQKELEAPTEEGGQLDKITNYELRIEEKKETPSILTQKLSGSFQFPKVETNHSLGNLSSSDKPSIIPKVDPYREPTEE